MIRRLYQHIYLAAYSGWMMPRFARRLIARSEAHRAWLLGHGGWFEQDGENFGPANPYRPPLLEG